MEELCKLESLDLTESRLIVSKLHQRLKSCRDPLLLGELVDFYFTNGSKGARKLLTSLREAHSQDFFDKLNESIQKTSSRLPVLKLLAHTLNSQTSWLYRIVDHPLFTSMLEQLKILQTELGLLKILNAHNYVLSRTSNDIVVLCSALLVVTAILPLVPSYIGNHLQDLFQTFCSLTAIKDTKRLGVTPKELCLHLDVAVYYFFLQLYALFPNNLFQFLRHHYGHSSTEGVNKFLETVAPLFYQVQLHPGLITDGSSYELSKTKWGAMEPDDIATLSLQLCLDHLIAVQGPPSREDTPQHSLTTSVALPSNRPDNSVSKVLTTPLVTLTKPHGNSSAVRNLVHTLSSDERQFHLNNSTGSSTQPPLAQGKGSHSNIVASTPYSNSAALSELPEPAGLKSSEELRQFWSPSITLGNITPRRKCSINISPNDSNRSSVNLFTHPSLQSSNISSPLSDSAISSTLPTPLVCTSSASTQLFTFKNYSPTASIESEPVHPRHHMTQSAVHPSQEDSRNSNQSDPISRSMKAESSFLSGSGTSRQKGSQNRSLREKFGRFIGMFVSRTADVDSSAPPNNDDFIEISPSDVNQPQDHVRSQLSSAIGNTPTRKTNPSLGFGGRDKSPPIAVVTSCEEVGEECVPELTTEGPVLNSQCETSLSGTAPDLDTSSAGHSSSNTSQQTPAGPSPQAHQNAASNRYWTGSRTESIDLPSNPLSSRRSCSDSDSSQQESHESRASMQTQTRDSLELKFPTTRKHFSKSFEGSPLYSLSFPERGAAGQLQAVCRTRNSNSEASTTHTVLMVQERLKELVQNGSSTSGRICSAGYSNSMSVPVEEAGIFGDSSSDTPVVGRHEFELDVSMDSAVTVLQNLAPTTKIGDLTPPPTSFEGTNGPRTLGQNFNASPMKGNQPPLLSSSVPCSNASSTVLSSSASANNLGVGLASRLFVRRVSVCSRIGAGNRFSECSAESGDTEPIKGPGVSSTHPSPAALLDKYISEGVVLHKGHIDTIPLTELEGVDWNHFGSCPHSEESGVMQAQVVLLHSQLLFERYQCLQHARRNRTLLSQARSAAQVVEELSTLRDQLYKHNLIMSSLQEELQASFSRQMNTLKFQEVLQTKNRTLTSENKALKDSNLKLVEEVQLLQMQNSDLQKKLNHSDNRLFSLENDHSHLKSQLEQAEKLKNEVEVLTRELQVLGDLYEQEREQSLRLSGQPIYKYEAKTMHSALKHEKEAAEKKAMGFQLQLRMSQAKVAELEDVVAKKEAKIDILCGKLQTIQGQYLTKMAAIEDNYQSMKVIGLHLENHVLELKGKSPFVKRKRHKRSSSIPSGRLTSSPRLSTQTPSPYSLASPTPAFLIQ